MKISFLLTLALSLLIAFGVALRVLPTRHLLRFLTDGHRTLARPMFWALRLRRARDAIVIDRLLLLLLVSDNVIADLAQEAVERHANEIHRSPKFYRLALSVTSTDEERVAQYLALCSLPFVASDGRSELLFALLAANESDPETAASLAAAARLLDSIAQQDGVSEADLTRLLLEVPRRLPRGSPSNVERDSGAALKRIAQRLAWRVRSGHIPRETATQLANELGLLIFQAPNSALQPSLQGAIDELTAPINAT